MNIIDFFQNGMNLWDAGLTSLIPSTFLVYIAILWISLIFWTVRDSFMRSENFFFQFFAAFLVTFFSIFGFFVYLIIRPPLFLAEKKLLEPENTEFVRCAKCQTECKKNFLYCPKCKNPLQLRSNSAVIPKEPLKNIISLRNFHASSENAERRRRRIR